MLRVLPLLVPLLLSITTLNARPLPFTAKDISLMLRSGYTSDTIIEDLSKRHFADTIDAAKEKMLVQAGATPALVDALKKGTYSVSPEEAARAKAELEAQQKRRAAQVEESRKFSTIYQDQLARERARSPQDFKSADKTSVSLKGSLVRVSNNSFVRVDDDAIEKKKLIAYYFSAHWCGPCRKFTPQLVEYYNRVAAQHPEFEIVFYSMDKSAGDMERYMRESKMPWPAIDYDKREEKEELKKAYGGGIPSLVLVESTGKLLSSSFDGQKYVGPKKVLADLDAIFAGKFAQAR